MKIFVSSSAKILAVFEIENEYSFFITNSERIQKALSPLPLKKNEKLSLDAATAVVILEQLLPSLQAMDPILEETITSPDLTLKRVLNALDDRKILISDLDSDLAYDVDYDTGKISYIRNFVNSDLQHSNQAYETSVNLLGEPIFKATIGDLVSNH